MQPGNIQRRAPYDHRQGHARSVIDGVRISNSHGEWPWQSWGIGAREDHSFVWSKTQSRMLSTSKATRHVFMCSVTALTGVSSRMTVPASNTVQ